MSQQKDPTTLLVLIDRMRECRKKQKAFRKEKNTPNYKAMIVCEDSLDALLSEIRKNVLAHYELNIEVL